MTLHPRSTVYTWLFSTHFDVLVQQEPVQDILTFTPLPKYPTVVFGG